MRETKHQAGDRGDASSPGKRTVFWRPHQTGQSGPESARKPVAEIIASLGPAFHLFLMVHGITRLIGYFPSLPNPEQQLSSTFSISGGATGRADRPPPDHARANAARRID
jgi:hypothetical protein